MTSRHAILAIPLLLLTLPLHAGAENSVVASSRITGVTVYADRALVSRGATVTLQPGVNVVAFDALPALLLDDSLRAEGKGAAQAKIAGLTVKNVFLEQLQEKKIRELEEELKVAGRKAESIEARKSALASQKDFIDSIRVGWGERISRELTLGKPTAAELGEALKFVGDGMARVEEQRYDAEAEKKPLADRIAALRRELEQAKGGRRKEVRAVEVAIESPRQMEFALQLSYVVPRTGWQPTYDVRLAPDGKSADLTYRALVWQTTAEEWPGVRLSLSTAAPEAGGAPPELFPWHVSLYEPPHLLREAHRGMEMMAVAPAPAPMVAKSRAADAGAPEEEAVPEQAQVAEGLTSVLFQVPQPVDIPGDGTRKASVIALEKLPVTAEYLTVPKLSQRVYLKSEVTNATAYPLLAGPVNVFNDNTFTGKGALKTVAAGEKFDLFFGADDRVKVKREVAKVKKDAGFLGGNRVSYRCSVELQNFRKEAIPLSLLDQLPLPGNEEIKVKLEDPSLQPTETKPDGTLVWKLQLQPGEKKTVTYDIVIDYPKGRELAGVE